ncbi:MAG: hypothetical protein NTW02_08945 [Cyanobium sp. LacPavin_0920_WC12_MAG_62_9]|nr:hypothetical protein [Cyanobium sp. LacPavin_0920_WC12_MAG_62_9]
MDNKYLDLLELNRQVLLSPGQCGKDPVVNLLEIDDPSLAFLCPLAKAIYLIETGRLELLNKLEALQTIHLIDDSRSGRPGDDDCDDLDKVIVEEFVDHSIHRSLCGKEIVLGFRSTGTMYYEKRFWRDYLRTVKLTGLDLLFLENYRGFLKWCLESLSATSKTIVPRCYPTEKDEFIGQCDYQLTTINGASIDGPSLLDQRHNIELRNPIEDYVQQDGVFCWLHYLDKRQAELLGLAEKSDYSSHLKDSKYPEWIPQSTTEKDLEQAWVGSAELTESYLKGNLIASQSEQGWIAVGSGSHWLPEMQEGIDSDADGLEEILIYD